MKQFISWRRVSTRMQGRSGLGLEAQMDIIKHFVQYEKGTLIADYCEVYTGTDLKGCLELREAISHCRQTGATLIIAKTDRFRNTAEALEIYDSMEGNIYFCDLPSSDKFTLTLFFALAEREATLISIRTKAALQAKKARGEQTGGTHELWGTNTGSDRTEAMNKARAASAESRTAAARLNPANIAFYEFIQDWEDAFGKITRDTWPIIVDKLNARGRKTATGLPFNINRAMSMYKKVTELFS